MSIRLMTQVWELDLPHPQLLVALALADWGNDDGSSIYPSLASVGWKCGYSDRQVRRIVRELETAGLLVKVAEPTRDRGTEYQLVVAAGRPKPPRTGADKLSGGQNDRPDIPGPGGGHPDPQGADTAMTAEPSVEPSVNRPASSEAGLTDPLDQEVERLCQLMSSEVRLAHDIPSSSKEARVTKGWRGACRGLLTRDGYTPAQIEYAIRWTVRSGYWRTRVKSMTRLRGEMPVIAKQLREERDRRAHLLPTDGLAGYSPEQRARLERRARRAAQLQTNPNGGTNGHHRSTNVVEAPADRPQPRLPSGAAA